MPAGMMIALKYCYVSSIGGTIVKPVYVLTFLRHSYPGIFVSGYDGSLLNGLQAMSTWQRYFDSPTGNILGLVSASAYFPT